VSINIVAIAQGSSELNISFVVAAKDVAAAQRAVHAAFQLSKIGGGTAARATNKTASKASPPTMRFRVFDCIFMMTLFFNRIDGSVPLVLAAFEKTGRLKPLISFAAVSVKRRPAVFFTAGAS